MVRTLTCFLSGALLCVLGFSLHAVERVTTTQIEKQHYVVDAGSSNGAAVISWLQQRESEGQSSALMDKGLIKGLVFSIDISTTAQHTNALSNAGMNEKLGGDFGPPPSTGVVLPKTGSPGQTITITSCEPGVGTVSETYTWKVGKDGRGSWELTDVKTHLNSSVTCISP